MLQRLLAPSSTSARRRARPPLLMFLYSFLAMTAYNIIKPITRSKFIADLGADNLPYVQFAAGVLIGFLMQGYSGLMGRLPRTLGASRSRRRAWRALLVALLVPVPDRARTWVSVAFYCLRPDPRHPAHQPVLDAGQRHLRPAAGQAPLRLHRRRAPASAASPGAGADRRSSRADRHDNLLLVSAAILALCAVVVVSIMRREQAAPSERRGRPARKKGVSGGEAIQLLRELASTCRSSRSSSALRRSARRSSSSSSTWRRRPPRARQHRRDHRVPRRRCSSTVDHRLRHPGLAHEPHPPLPRASASRC